MSATLRRLLGALTFAALPFVAGSAAVAQPLSVDAGYVVTMAGNILANLDIGLRETGTDYSIEVDARVSGLGQFVASGSARVDSSGRTTRRGYAGEAFNLTTNTSDGRIDIEVTYTGGNVNSFTVDPPMKPRLDRVPIERAQLTGVNDMLSAFIIKGDALDAGICNRTLKIFTGTERFDLGLRFAGSENATSERTGYQGPVVLCQVDYRPISGHYESSDVTNYLADSERILVWFAPVAGGGTFIPYRVLIGTALGDLSMVLTDLG